MMAKVLVEEEGTGLGGEGRARISPLELCEDKSETQKQQMGGCRPNPARRCVLFGLRNVYQQSI